MLRLLSILAAIGTILTNSTTETVLATATIPAGFLRPGKVIKFRGIVHVIDNNSTDTLTVYVRLGDTTLTGTAIVTSAAVDVADDDYLNVEGSIRVYDYGTSQTAYCEATYTGPDAAGTAAQGAADEVGTLDLTADLLLELTGEWSVAHADNECRAVAWEVYEIA